MQRSLLDADNGAPSSWPFSEDTLSTTSSPQSRLASLCSSRPSSVSQRSVTLLAVLLTLCLVTLCVLAAVLASIHSTSAPPTPPPSSLPSSSTGPSPPSDPALAFALGLQLTDLMPHIRRFQSIANASSGTRVISGPGYNLSVSYVLSQLSSTSLRVRLQPFTVERWQVQSASLSSQSASGPLTWQYLQDFTPITNSGRSGLNYDNSSLAPIPRDGCAESDWSPQVKGRVALVQRGVGACTFARQSQLAVSAQAAGLVISNTAANESITTTATVAAYTPIPVYLVTWEVGVALSLGAEGGGRVQVVMELVLGSTAPLVVNNVIADTGVGDNSSTVVIGTHLDGVAAGAGINDNASGSSANLAIALAVDRMISSGQWSLPNRIRFIWFAAEENGLFGSRYHVQQASLPDRVAGERISDYAAMVNYDSIASPNGFYAVYDAQELPSSTPARAVNGSQVISSLHYSYFAQLGLPSEPTGMGGGSDYVGFLESGVACGGLYGGLTEVKTRDLRDRYEAQLGVGRGGVANAQLDPCYHKYCDDQQNINQPAYLDMARSAAFTVASMALHPQLRSFLQYPPP